MPLGLQALICKNLSQLHPLSYVFCKFLAKILRTFKLKLTESELIIMAGLTPNTLQQNVTTVVQIDPCHTESYSWTVKVPPKSRMIRNFKSEYGIVLGPVEFSTGILSNISHCVEMSLEASINKIVLCWKIDPKVNPSTNVKVDINQIKVQLLEGEEIARTEICQLSEPRFNPARKLDEYIIEMVFTHWTETVDAFKIVVELNVEKGAVIKHQQIVNDDNEDDGIIHLRRSISRGMRHMMNFHSFHLSEFLSDVVICCDNEEFHAHKVVLSNRSPVFQKMFEDSDNENDKAIGKVDIHDVEVNSVKQFIQWMYNCSQLNATELSEQVELFKIADRYCVDTLKNICTLRMIESVTVDNAVEMFAFGDRYRVSLLKKRALRFMKI